MSSILQVLPIEQALDHLVWTDHWWVNRLVLEGLDLVEFRLFDQVTAEDWTQMRRYYDLNQDEFNWKSTVKPVSSAQEYPLRSEDYRFLEENYLGYQCQNRIYLAHCLKNDQELAQVIAHEMTHFFLDDPLQYFSKLEKNFHEFRATLVEYWLRGYSAGDPKVFWLALEEVRQIHLERNKDPKNPVE